MSSKRENTRACCKCESSTAEDSSITLHRFPNPGPRNILRCELWAKYSFPNEAWSSPNFQRKLYSKHKMLCSKHFRASSFINNKLFKTAVPDVENDESHPSTTQTTEIEKDPLEETGTKNTESIRSKAVKRKAHTSTTEVEEDRLEEIRSKNTESIRTKEVKRKAHTSTTEVEEDRLEEIRSKNTDSIRAKVIIRKANLTPVLQEVREDLTNALNRVDQLITNQLEAVEDEEEDDIYLYGKLLAQKLRKFSQRERQEIMYEIDGLLLNRLCSRVNKNHDDSVVLNMDAASVISQPASPSGVLITKRSRSISSPYNSPLPSP